MPKANACGCFRSSSLPGYSRLGFGYGGLPAGTELSEQIQRLLGISHRETYAVVAKINEHFLSFRLDTVDCSGEKNMLAMAKQRANCLFPLAGELVQKFDGGFRRVSGDLDFALVVSADRNCGFLLNLVNGDDLVEVN